MRAFMSPRYLELDKFERYVVGTQYEGRPHWYNDEVPLTERAPNVVEHVASEAIKSFGDLLAGHEKWPDITSHPDEEETELEDPLRLSEEQSDQLDRGMRAITRQAKMHSTGRDALRKAMGGKSVATVATLKLGKLHLQNYRGKLCEPKFEGDELLSLDIRYPYMKRVWEAAKKKWVVKTYLYRRKIDKETDTTYEAVEVEDSTGLWPEDGSGEWRIKEEILHNLQFVPVVWYGFERDEEATGVVDGYALHEQLLDEIDALNRALSQHNRAGLYSGDPQWTEHGVSANEMPGPAGRASNILYPGEAASPAGKSWANWRPNGGGSGGGPRRRKGAGVIWTYSDPTSKAVLHTLRGDALESIARDRDDLRETIASGMSWVRLGSIIARDREGSGITIRNLTGEAIRWLMKPQLSRANGMRIDFGDGWILPMMDLLLRMVLVLNDREQLLLPGVKATATVVANFLRDFASGDVWAPPEFTLLWPEYFSKTALEDMQEAEAVRADYDAQLITMTTAVDARAKRYNIEDTAAYVVELKAENEERAEELHALMAETQPKQTGPSNPSTKPNNGPAKSPGTGSEKKRKREPKASRRPTKTGKSGP